MADSLFAGVISTLEGMGFFTVVLPFLLVFAIIYGVLERSKIFEERHDIHAVIAFVISMMVIGTAYIVGILLGFLPLVGLLSVIFIGGLILYAIFAGEMTDIYNTKAKYLAAAVILIVFPIVLINLAFPEFFSEMTQGGALPFNMADIGALVVILGIMFGLFWITKPSKGGSS